MFKRTLMAASLAVAALASAQSMAAVVGGGATLPEGLYNDSAFRPSTFDVYVGVGSGAGKTAFLKNDATQFGKAAGVPVSYAGSDSILSSGTSTAELETYNTAHNTAGLPNAANWGPLIQIPSVGTSVTIPYNKSGITNLDLTSAQLCQAFSGQAATWGALLGTTDTTPIVVVYRSGSSGTSEVLSRHLNSQCPTLFTTSSTFTTAQTGAEPANWIAVATSGDMASTVAATPGAIGYVGPDSVDATNNAVVAKVNGLLPTVGNVTTALSAIAPPTGTARNNPANWAPVLANPATGYSLVAYTFLDIGQCYRDAAVTTSVRDFMTKHYGAISNNDSIITAHKFIPLSGTWKSAIRGAFLTSNSLAVGDTSVCNGIGRPL
ncbi:protein disulfide reductase [Pseudomonas gingeri NCPPB 3146 = LMG 5327]|uniref:Substrate-binding domain-containing protein n=2 Tax=Pseudomonas gingeri TaxID=117681 RepID=A0A7Y8CCX6_9PSED|nr:substrate-binding domain-containing protein [Pseudomonas gingeri]NVZ24498.1 substrate-binding domain-containing protein [Pseudomonas gingeri]NWC13437.1 substrate-binding domain-containing protein [Pseudomonas gingeri]NWE45146.1 substrate-binding domain-containing protein [Pseudomonas gingeri]NWE71228.1 substrate-binding domain-containing protein [Pseudomonas gingeri]PNQ94477.1 protein disulfide reductase [Pseudomonas gingeri NCPPB 3146 = LMG 5327]